MTGPRKPPKRPTHERQNAERRRTAAELLGSGHAVGVVSEQLGIDHATVWRWRQDPEFCALVEAARSRLVDSLRERLRAGAGQAIEALLAVASDEGAPPASRVSAATAILDRVGLARRTEVEATVAATTEIRVDLSGASLEQLAALAGGGDDDEGSR